MFLKLHFLFLPLIATIITTILLIYFSQTTEIGIDNPNSSNHKIHKKSIPRIGGIAIFVPFFITFFSILENKVANYNFLIIVSLPFIIGLWEDVFQNLSANLRFILIALCSLISLIVVEEKLVITNIGFELPFYFAILFTIFAFTGITNSINLIDGLNGLSSGIVLTALTFMLLISFENFYLNVYNYLLILEGSILGFFVINFFTGKIFLGDAGAYFIGFICAITSAILANRGGNISPWFFVVLFAYPIFDTLFSIYRRKFLKGENAFKPDCLHLHSLIYKRVFKNQIKATGSILIFNLLFSIAGYFFREKTIYLIAIFLIFCAFYVSIYAAIVKFKMNNKF